MEPYRPIYNPGAWEKRMLADHPDWVEKHPQRLLGARDFDQRLISPTAAWDSDEGELELTSEDQDEWVYPPVAVGPDQQPRPDWAKY
jgi:hypothetical protein